MSAGGPPCVECGAELAAGQEYCLECGASQITVSPRWRRALIAAAVTVALSALVLVLGYERMRDDADGDAAVHAARDRTVKQAGASGPAGGSGSRKQVPAAQISAGQTP
jgi:hypothetical protein